MDGRGKQRDDPPISGRGKREDPSVSGRGQARRISGEDRRIMGHRHNVMPVSVQCEGVTECVVWVSVWCDRSVWCD